MKKWIQRLWLDESGQDMAEYTLLIVLIAIAAVGSVTAFGTNASAGLSNAAVGINTGLGGGP